MSTFFAEIVTCPHCGKETKQSVAHSVNVTRTPEYRERILEGEFQHYICPNCSQDYFVDRPFFYIDFDRKDWIGVFPLSEEDQWQQWENEVVHSFHLACGVEAPVIAHSIGQEMKIRTVFGLVALREKLLCAELELDDIALELLKFRLMQVPGGCRLSKDDSLRLIEFNDKQLIFTEVASGEEQSRESEVLVVDRKAYQEIVNEIEQWEAIKRLLCQGSYVDIGRFLKFKETNNIIEENHVYSTNM